MHGFFFFLVACFTFPLLQFTKTERGNSSSFKTTPFSSLKTEEEEEGTYTNTNKDDDGR